MRSGDTGAQRQASYTTPVPPAGATRQAKTIPGVIAAHHQRAASADAPSTFVNALQAGVPGTLHKVVINYVDVQYTTTEAAAGCDPARAAEAWLELRHAFTITERSGLSPALPRELATATWEHAGRRIHIYRPGAPSGQLRRARTAMRRRLAALSPVPALAGFGQTLAGGATAVGMAVTPLIPMTDVPVRPPLSMPVIADATNRAEMPEWFAPSTTGAGPSAARKSPAARRATVTPTASASPDTLPTPPLTSAPVAPSPRFSTPQAATSTPAPVTTPTVEAPEAAASPAPTAEPSPEPTIRVKLPGPGSPTAKPSLRLKRLHPPHPRPHQKKPLHRRHLLPEFLRHR